MIISNLGSVSHHFRDRATYNLKLSIENCGQIAAVGDMVTIDAVSDGTVADILQLTV